MICICKFPKKTLATALSHLSQHPPHHPGTAFRKMERSWLAKLQDHKVPKISSTWLRLGGPGHFKRKGLYKNSAIFSCEPLLVSGKTTGYLSMMRSFGWPIPKRTPNIFLEHRHPRASPNTKGISFVTCRLRRPRFLRTSKRQLFR